MAWCSRDPLPHLFHRFAVPLPLKGKVSGQAKSGNFSKAPAVLIMARIFKSHPIAVFPKI
jgi:hypothetical protein